MKALKFIAALMLATSAASAAATSLKVGQPAPNAELVLANGQRMHLSELRG